MAISSGFFRSVGGDRKYTADFFSSYFASFIGNGVFPNPSTNLQALYYQQRTVIVKPGKAWINGHYLINDSDFGIQLDAPDPGLNRIDRIVVALNNDTREMSIYLKKGTPASNAIAPVLVRNNTIYELALADVLINPSSTTLSQANITDQRLNNDLCGLVHGLIKQIDTTTLFNQIQQNLVDFENIQESDFLSWSAARRAEFDAWYADVMDVLDGDVAANLLNRIVKIEENLASLTSFISDFGAVGDGTTDDTAAILAAANSGKVVTFPKGRYVLNASKIDLAKGTFFKGINAGETVLSVTADQFDPYLFRTNLYTGFENIRILFTSRFDGDAILHESGYISANNNNTEHFARNNVFNNVEVDFLYKSGYGNGLKLLIRNFDEFNNNYPAAVVSHLLYLNVENFETRYGNSCINIQVEQKNPVNRAVWFTATKFINIRADSCLYGIYLNTVNSSTSPIRDVADILFDKLEIQCQAAGFFDSSTNQTQPIYIKGTPSRQVFCNFNNLTIWDSNNGISGYLENATVRVVNGYLGFTVSRGLGLKQGFQLTNSTLDFNEDVTRLRMTSPAGRIVDITPTDGGIQFRDNPEGENGYIARGQLTERLTPGTNNAMVSLEAYDKLNGREAYLEMGYGTGFKGSTQGIFNVSAKAADGVLRQVVNYGSEGLIYNTVEMNKGFYSGNGVYIKYEKHTLNIPPNENYVSLTIPIDEVYNQIPFLMNCVVETVDNNANLLHDVFIRDAFVSANNAITVRVKHNKSSTISIRFGTVVAAYKTFPTTP